MPSQQMRPPEQAQDQGHDRVRDLLGPGGVHVDEAEPELGGEGGVDGAVGGAEAEDELVGAEAALGGAGEEGEGVEEDGGGGVDGAVGGGEAAEGDVLDGGDAGEGVLLEGAVLDAVEGDDEGEGRGVGLAGHHREGRGSGHCSRRRRTAGGGARLGF